MPLRFTAFKVITAPALVGIITSVPVWRRFDAELAAARALAAQPGVIASTRCGPIEYEAVGQGAPLLVIHGSGGSHDQGMDFGRAFAQQGMRVIAPSRFGCLRTPLPADASPAAQADAHTCLLDALGVPRAAVIV